ncbi:histidinol-phosphatase HisJ family protein [Paenibacillaceae bacterium]|nr:histidinol-phosphatase HisJ family protein [Paenibacillaceae bacterium]
MKFDLHTHHDRCGHAEGKIRDYIEAAIANGLQFIGISDHSPFLASEVNQLNPAIAMANSELPEYVAEVLHLKEQYRGKIEVLLGIESDFFPEHAELYRGIYAKYPFDYIIGSVHVSNGKHIFDKTRWDNVEEQQLKQEAETYLGLIQASAKSGMFDILGHIDAIKGFCPAISQHLSPLLEQTLQVIGSSGTAIEVNTSGKFKASGGWHPSTDILERAAYHNVAVTFGSDSHVPERVGDEWETVRETLKQLGFKEWTFFRERKRHHIPL